MANHKSYLTGMSILRQLPIGQLVCLLCVAACQFSTLPARCQSLSAGGIFSKIGVDAGEYLPTSAKTRDSFGSTWFSVGLGIGGIGRASDRGKFDLDFDSEYGSRNSNNYAVFFPVGIAYRRALVQIGHAPHGANVPYFGFSADYVPTITESEDNNLPAAYRSAGGGSGFVGTTFGQLAYVEARYQYVSRVRGYDLSGTDLTVGVRF